MTLLYDRRVMTLFIVEIYCAGVIFLKMICCDINQLSTPEKEVVLDNKYVHSFTCFISYANYLIRKENNFMRKRDGCYSFLCLCSISNVIT